MSKEPEKEQRREPDSKLRAGPTVQVTKEKLKELVCRAIDARRDEIIGLGEDIFAHPELAYRERRTAGKVEEKLIEMGLEYQKNIAVTGLKARLEGRGKRPLTVGLIGELDAVICPLHPNADPETGAAHACAHNAQIASMLGAALGLQDAGAMNWLGGDVCLLAVPSEEGLGIPSGDDPVHRLIGDLLESGRIQFTGGKQQFIVEGALDDVDMAMMVHTGPMSTTMMEDSPHGQEFKMGVGGGFAGSVSKTARFIGREAHPGVAAHLGVNAQSAAALALMAINAHREAFRDQDTVRVHPVITKSGRPHAIPGDVQVEVFIRSSNVEALMDACRRVDLSLEAGALAMGAKVRIKTKPGYLPFMTEPAMDELFRRNAERLVGKDWVGNQRPVPGTTDMGDVSHLMPTIHARSGGVVGRAHEADYRIVDKELAYIAPAKAMAMTVIDLLWEDAGAALEIKKNHRPVYTRETYLKAWQEIMSPKAN